MREIDVDCAAFQERLPLVIVDKRDLAERAALAEHAAGCMPCRRMMQEWEEAQRALETALGSSPLDPRRLQALSETLYAERFGSTIDLKTAATAVPVAAGWAIPLLIGAAVGVLVGYLAWGGGGQGNPLAQQLWLQELMAAQGISGGNPFLTGGLAPRMGAGALFGTAGSLVRDLFCLCLIVWLCRSRLWEVLFPAALPKGVYMARLLAIPLVIIGVCRIALTAFLTSSIGVGLRPVLLNDLPTAGGLLLLDALWSCGFWLVIFILLFTAGEHLMYQYLRPKEAKGRRM